MVQLRYPSGEIVSRPLSCLEAVPQESTRSIAECFRKKYFGNVRDLQRLVTYEKLKGTLHEVIYSMEAAQIDFYPYQFKPVIKFINSPTERLIIADEVGLGKTIESALIWVELQARHQAKRLLVVCPNILAEKWRAELRNKFLIDARVVKLPELEREVDEAVSVGRDHAFALIATYTGLRPPRVELPLLRASQEPEFPCSPKTRFLRKLINWPLDFSPFDLVIFDEAHYMRNPATTTFHLGEGISSTAGAVLCVSATPVNNSNTDLHSLLRLIDEGFFETQGLFEELLYANSPTVQAGNALARIPIDRNLLEQAVAGMGRSRFISRSPLFEQFSNQVQALDPENKPQLARCQDLAEKLNLMGGYVNRTRRVQVKENRPIRVPLVLTVEYTPEEMGLYRLILRIVRLKCLKDNRPFHIFQVIGLQLRAASCLPAVAREIREGRFGDANDLLAEAMGDEVVDDLFDDLPEEEFETEDCSQLLDYDFETNDSKYQHLRQLLLDTVPKEKVIVFAYYRPTLSYLSRRLACDGVRCAVIHGGIVNEERWEQIEHFEDPAGPRVLLSSEVGSEGIDLQFCRVLVNYDLPWNPMRVEQRIGRIDRVGQREKRLSIVNFKVVNTIEERLFERLHTKLEMFANSLGDLEAIIGRKVQELTVALLSRELSAEEENQLMDQAEQVIEQRLIQIQALEEAESELTVLADYVQRKIEEDRGKGRYIQPDELEDYLNDFFEREFQGSEICFNTPAEGCILIRLSHEAQVSLNSFMRGDTSLSARPLRSKEFAISFRRDAVLNLPAGQKRTIHFINHLSPLVRWITKINQDRAHAFFKVSAVRVTHPGLQAGDYAYRLERWRMKGLSSRETLAYGVCDLLSGRTLSGDEAEAILQSLLRRGRDWIYVDRDTDLMVQAHQALERDLSERFSAAVIDFEAENKTVYQIKMQRVHGFYSRRITQDEQRLRTLRESGRDPGVIRMSEGRLRTAIEKRQERLQSLERDATTDFEQEEVAAGIFCVSAEQNKEDRGGS